MPSAIKPKNGGSRTGSGIEAADVLMDKEDRGEVRRGEPIGLLGVHELLEALDNVRLGNDKG